MAAKKRKADFQLSPHTRDEDVVGLPEKAEHGAHVVQQRIAHVRKRPESISYGGRFTGVFAGKELFSGLESSGEAQRERSALNQCFLDAVKRVLQTDTSKDLSFLFEQYTLHSKAISETSGAEKSGGT